MLAGSLGLQPAMAHEPGSYESPIVEARVKRFKESGADIQAIFKKHLAEKNFRAIEGAALRMAEWGREMPVAFPEGSSSIGADPAIWENFSDFRDLADRFAVASDRLRYVAQSEDLSATKSAAQAVGASCKACHSKYRIKH